MPDPENNATQAEPRKRQRPPKSRAGYAEPYKRLQAKVGFAREILIEAAEDPGDVATVKRLLNIALKTLSEE
jgi:hypothetical protein